MSLETIYIVRHGTVHKFCYVSCLRRADEKRRFQGELDHHQLVSITSLWIFIYRGVGTDEDISLRRKSVTGLPRDPPLAAFGEVRSRVDPRYLHAFTVAMVSLGTS
jgi:hypothetical protein